MNICIFIDILKTLILLYYIFFTLFKFQFLSSYTYQGSNNSRSKTLVAISLGLANDAIREIYSLISEIVFETKKLIKEGKKETLMT